MNYRVLLSGRDVTLCSKSGGRRVGFFASNLVSAENRIEAERIAKRKTFIELKARNDFEACAADDSSLHLERLEVISGTCDHEKGDVSRFTFFLEDE